MTRAGLPAPVPPPRPRRAVQPPPQVAVRQRCGGERPAHPRPREVGVEPVEHADGLAAVAVHEEVPTTRRPLLAPPGETVSDFTEFETIESISQMAGNRGPAQTLADLPQTRCGPAADPRADAHQSTCS